MGKFVLGNCNVSLRSCANRKKESERVNRASGESRHSLAPRDMGQGSPGRRYGGLSTPAWGPKPGHALPDQADAGVTQHPGVRPIRHALPDQAAAAGLVDAGPGRPATGTATAVGALLPGRDRVDHRLDALYLCLGQYSVAKVEDVAGAPAHGFQKADRLSPRHVGRRVEDRRVKVALDGDVFRQAPAILN